MVIGPLDQYWLKRIKRPMLTWITFPCYVVLFSLLIYFIGYKLRAGETEWNELHLVDVLQNGDARGIARPHLRLDLFADQRHLSRGKRRSNSPPSAGNFKAVGAAADKDGERADVLQTGDNFKADIFVPVWTSQLFVSDWWQSAPLPLKIAVTSDGGNWAVTVTNLRDHPLTECAAGRGRSHDGPRRTCRRGRPKPSSCTKGQGTLLRDFVSTHGGRFSKRVRVAPARLRRHRQRAHRATCPTVAMAVSFISQCAATNGFIAPPGLDLSPLVEQGNAVLLAWESGLFARQADQPVLPRRSHKDTLWRMSVPVNAASAP